VIAAALLWHKFGSWIESAQFQKTAHKGQMVLLAGDFVIALGGGDVLERAATESRRCRHAERDDHL